MTAAPFLVGWPCGAGQQGGNPSVAAVPRRLQLPELPSRILSTEQALKPCLLLCAMQAMHVVGLPLQYAIMLVHRRGHLKSSTVP